MLLYIPNIIDGANQLVGSITEFFRLNNTTYLIGGCAAGINAIKFTGSAHRPAFDVDIVCKEAKSRSRKTIKLGSFDFGIDIMSQDELNLRFSPVLESTNGITQLSIWSGSKSSSVINIPTTLHYESLSTLLPNKAHLMEMHYLSRLGEMSKEIFDIAVMSRFLDNSTVLNLNNEAPNVISLFYLSSAMVLARSKNIAHRNISSMDISSIISASENSASRFYSAQSQSLRLLVEQRPMLLPTILFNAYDIFMKEKREQIKRMDTHSDNTLKAELSAINMSILDALRRSDSCALSSIASNMKDLMRRESVGNNRLVSCS